MTTSESEMPSTEPSLTEHTIRIDLDGRKCYLVGTAHVSKESVAEVEAVIQKVRPDVVCVELCQSRYQALTDRSRWKDLDIFQVIREGKTLFLLANLAIGAYQRRLGAQLGVKPGAELLAAVECAEQIGARVELIDREIHTTLKRAWRNVGFLRKAELIGAIMASLVSKEGIEEAELEELKTKAHLSEMMQEFADALPEVKVPLIDERDQYMSARIREVEGRTLVAVVGAGHVQGMRKWLHEDIDRARLEAVPPPSKLAAALKWVIPALVLAAFYYGYSINRGKGLMEFVTAWVLPNSIAAAFLTAIAGGKPLSVLAAFIGSPITSLNPLINSGMVVGLVEAWLRRPTVEDAERINEDVQSLKGLYKNRFTRVLLVAVAATMGSALGAWIGIGWIFTLLRW